MKYRVVAAAAFCLFTGITDAQYHDPSYLMGGNSTTLFYCWNGVWLADVGKKTLKHLTPNHKIYHSRSIYMDADNRRVVLAVQGTTAPGFSSFVRSGIYRLDPGTLSLSTVMADTLALYAPSRLIINQDGDYVFTCYTRKNNLWQYAFLKLKSGGSLTTLLNSTKLGTSTLFAHSTGRNMDTGNYLFNVCSPPNHNYTVLDVDDTGKFTTFGGGASPNYGWYGYYANLEQNFDTGHIEGHERRVLYQLKKGAPTRTTLAHLGYPSSYYMQYTSNFDLQSAAAKRIVASGYVHRYQSPQNPTTFFSPAVYYIDTRPPHNVTAVTCDPKNTLGAVRGYFTYSFDFYRGRHIQPVKTAPNRWNIHMSCPSHPGKNYVLLMSASGYRPGIKLPDGRTFHLNYDDFFNLSYKNWLRPYFDPGPLRLDSGGRAVGSIDVSKLPGLGIPIWIAMAVLDSKAPSGIAYLPDTYVMTL